MTKRILIVHPDQDLLLLIKRWISLKWKADVMIDTESNERNARRRLFGKLPQTYHLVISDLNLPESDDDVCDDRKQRGAQLLRDLRSPGPENTRKILIVPAYDPDLAEDLRECIQVPNGADLENSLMKVAARVIDANPAPVLGASPTRGPEADPLPCKVKVILVLDLENRTYTYQIKGEGIPYGKGPAALDIDNRKLKKIIQRSERFVEQIGTGNYSKWDDELRDIGTELNRHIFDNNQGLANGMYFAKGLIEGMNAAAGLTRGMNSGASRVERQDNRIICFAIGRSVHPAMLEAVTPEDEPDFLMLSVPIYRRLVAADQDPHQRAPLFRDESTFSALIVESPTEGHVELDGDSIDLEPLTCVASEAAWVEKKLKGCGADPILRIGPSSVPEGQSFKDYLEDILESGWDLVHYVGHSHYDELRGKGYLFLPGPRVATMLLDRFSVSLHDTRFLFLSSCKSAAAFELARNQIPAVIGFRWPIGDEDAMKFTKLFYDNLFEKSCGRSFESAFVGARKSMFKEDPKNPIWAAPILIMQTTD